MGHGGQSLPCPWLLLFLWGYQSDHSQIESYSQRQFLILHVRYLASYQRFDGPEGCGAVPPSHRKVVGHPIFFACGLTANIGVTSLILLYFCLAVSCVAVQPLPARPLSCDATSRRCSRVSATLSLRGAAGRRAKRQRGSKSVRAFPRRRLERRSKLPAVWAARERGCFIFDAPVEEDQHACGQS